MPLAEASDAALGERDPDAEFGSSSRGCPMVLILLPPCLGTMGWPIPATMAASEIDKWLVAAMTIPWDPSDPYARCRTADNQNASPLSRPGRCDPPGASPSQCRRPCLGSRRLPGWFPRRHIRYRPRLRRSTAPYRDGFVEFRTSPCASLGCPALADARDATQERARHGRPQLPHSRTSRSPPPQVGLGVRSPPGRAADRRQRVVLLAWLGLPG